MESDNKKEKSVSDENEESVKPVNKTLETLTDSYKSSYAPMMDRIKVVISEAARPPVIKTDSLVESLQKTVEPFKNINISPAMKALQKSAKVAVNIPKPVINEKLLDNINSLMFKQIQSLLEVLKPILNKYKEWEYFSFLGETGWASFDPSISMIAIDFLKKENYNVNQAYFLEKAPFDTTKINVEKFNVNEPFDVEVDHKIYKKYIEYGFNSMKVLEYLYNSDVANQYKETIEKIIFYLKRKDYKACEYSLFSLLETLVLDELSFMKELGTAQINGQAHRLINNVNSKLNDDLSAGDFEYKLELCYMQNMLCYNRLFQFVGDYEAYCGHHHVVNRNVLMHYGAKMKVTEEDVFKTVMLLYAMTQFEIPFIKVMEIKKEG